MWEVVEAVSLQSTAPKAFGEPGSASSVENSVMEMSPSLFRRVAGSEEPWCEEPRVAGTLDLMASICSRGTTWVSEADFLREPLVPRRAAMLLTPTGVTSILRRTRHALYYKYWGSQAPRLILPTVHTRRPKLDIDSLIISSLIS